MTEQRSRRAFFASLIPGLIISGLAGCGGSDRPTRAAPASETVVLAFAPQPDIAPFLIADAKGFWKAEGVKVDFRELPTGRLSFEAVLGGRADLAQVAETPLVNAAMQGRQFVILADFCSSDRSVRCIARADRGVARPAD